MTLDQFILVSRVHDVIQEVDGKFRLDIWIDNRTGEARQVAATILAQLPARWHSRLHIPYRERRARTPGRRLLRRNLRQPLGLTVASWNIRSFSAKKGSVSFLAKSNKVDILALQETLCRADSWAPKLAGFTVYSVAAGERGALGLALAIKRGIPSTLLERNCNWIICELRTATCLWIVANIYFPSGGTNHTVIRAFEQALERHAAIISRARLIILGDFNRDPDIINQLCWRWPASIARLPTRGSSGTFHGFRPDMAPTALDHILLGPMPQIQPQVSVLRGWSDSDHWPIMVRMPVELGELPRPVLKKVCSRTLSSATQMKFVTDNRWEVLAHDLADDNIPVNVAAPALLDVMTSVGLSNGGIREVGGPIEQRRCMTHKCRRALRNRTLAMHTYLSSGTEVDKARFIASRIAAKVALRTCARDSWAAHVEELRLAVGARRSKQAWAWMNKFLKPHRQYLGDSLPAIFNEFGELQTSEEGKASAWLDYYRQLFSDPTGHSCDSSWWTRFQAGPVSAIALDPLSEPWTPAELLRLLDTLVNGKAPGIDKIPPEWYKWLRLHPTLDGYQPPAGFPNHAAKALSLLFETIVASREIPTVWQQAEIVSIYKSGDCQRPENYRGIALIPVGLKILCSLVISRFNRTLAEHNLLCQEQAGFRSREECVGQIASLLELSIRRRTCGENTYMAFIDFKKAYDMVPHEALLAKLRWAGFTGIFMEFLEGLYRSSTVTPRGTSECVPVRRGLRQGCPMSPSLFNFFINDIFDPIGGYQPIGVLIPGDSGVISCRGLMFADDVVLLASSAEDLKGAIAHLERWANRWEMECGVRKCAIMLVSSSPEVDPIATLETEGPWRLHGQDVPLARTYRYLGFEFTDDLQPDVHMAARIQGAVGAFGRCHRFLTNPTIPLGIRGMAYKTMVLPVLSWGCELLPLDRTKTRLLGRVQNRQLRTLSGLRPNSSLGCPLAIGRELNIPPFSVRAATARVRLFTKAPTLKTWLHVLCDRGCKLPSKGTRPWILLTERWLRRRIRLYGPSTAPVYRWVRAVEWTHLTEHSQTTISLSRYNSCGFVRGRHYLEHGNYNLRNLRGQMYLFRLRTGSFLTVPRLAQMGFVDPVFRLQCPFCLETTPETVDHLLISCSSWDDARAHFLHDLFDLYLDRASASVLLLGGEIRGEHNNIGHIFIDGAPITLFTIAFLEVIMPQRLQTIASLRLAWPPRVNAPRGTTVLQYGTELTEPDGFAPQGVLVGRNPTYPELESPDS